MKFTKHFIRFPVRNRYNSTKEYFVKKFFDHIIAFLSFSIGICFLVSCLPVFCYGQIPSQGPAINLVKPDSVTIVWRTAEPAYGSIELTDLHGKTISITKENIDKPSSNHQVTLKNLKPQTNYGYYVLSSSATGWFKSEWIPFATAIKPNAPFRFASLSDSRGKTNGVNVEILSKIIQKVVDAKPNLMIFEGDLIGGSVDEPKGILEYDQWKKVVQPFWQSVPIYPGVGSHEMTVGSHKITDRPNGDLIFAQEFTLPENGPDPYKKIVYSFDYGNCHFISLNSSDSFNQDFDNYRFNQIQLDWLKKDLAATKQLHKFVYFHDPAYPSGTHIGTSLDKYPDDRDKFLKLCDQYGVEILFCGHEHNYDRKNLDNTLNPILHHTIYQVKNGTCGAPIYLKKDAKKVDERNQIVYREVYNYSIVDVDGPKVTVTAYDVDGNKIDQFSYQK
jgi:3',5'-cyclic-AMP phosphodiesterase